MRHQFGWDLPPGVSVSDIENAQGGELPIPTNEESVAWAEEATMIADVLRELSDKLNGVDNGHCGICGGFRLYNTRSIVQPCENPECLSHRVADILERYEKPTAETLERIKKNCLERITSECFCGTDLEAGICPNGHDPTQKNDLVDEVQCRTDQVVEAAVEWHQAGREGGEWMDRAEALSAAIDQLLALRETPKS